MKVELDIVLGSSYAKKAQLEVAAAKRSKTQIHTLLPDLSALMEKSDLSIGAGGSTTWERCCLGLPSIVISVAENQRPACEALAADRLIEYLGHFDAIGPEAIKARVLELIKKPSALSELSKNCMKIVHGIGAELVVNEIKLAS